MQSPTKSVRLPAGGGAYAGHVDTAPAWGRQRQPREKKMPVAAATLCLFLVLFTLSLPTVLAAAPNFQELALFYTNDVGGQTEPCG